MKKILSIMVLFFCSTAYTQSIPKEAIEVGFNCLARNNSIIINLKEVSSIIKKNDENRLIVYLKGSGDVTGYYIYPVKGQSLNELFNEAFEKVQKCI